ncbi:MAG: porin [Hyphomicrobiales bacterium]|nr:porin [Hyphomicrobiales bacterium]
MKSVALPLVLATTPVWTTAAFGEGIPKIEWELSNGGKVRIYGQINMGLLVYDDGYETNGYAPVDNDNSSSRIGVTYDQGLENDWKIGAALEVEYPAYSTNTISVTNDEPDWTWQDKYFRKIEAYISNDSYGKLSVGQGSMASDTTAEVDLSGTTVIAYSKVQATAGGQLFRDSDTAAFGPAVKSAFNNYDGLSRKVRIRYDTPKMAGFVVSASYGEDLLADSETPLADIALKYENKFDGFKVQGAIAYAWQENDVEIVDGSASILHEASGINFTVAAGSQDNGSRIGTYVYGKVGLLRDFVESGPTAFAVDYYYGEDIAALDSTSQSFGVAVVQNIKDYNTDLYLTYRRYAYDTTKADFEDGDAVLAGVRIKF